jgi:hypothetical protein
VPVVDAPSRASGSLAGAVLLARIEAALVLKAVLQNTLQIMQARSYVFRKLPVYTFTFSENQLHHNDHYGNSAAPCHSSQTVDIAQHRSGTPATPNRTVKTLRG